MPNDLKPNILFITTDQQRGDCFGFEGRNVRTPVLDKLASDGTRFANCITPNAVCQPARASILTGLLPNTHGVSDNGYCLSSQIGERGFAGSLTANGYDTNFIGKAHFSTVLTYAPTGSPECIHSSSAFREGWTGPYMGFDHAELMLFGHNWFDPEKPPYGREFERWFHADGRGDKKIADYWAGYWGDGRLADQTWKSELPLEWHNTTWVTDRTIDRIKSRGSKPWMIWASYPDPHHPFDAPQEWADMYDPDEVDLPPHWNLDLDSRPWWHRQAYDGKKNRRNRKTPPGQTEKMRMLAEHGNVLDRLRTFSAVEFNTERELRHMIANTYGMISFIDESIGRILAALEASGQADNTIVVFTSDHGDWLGDHGLVLKGPMLYDGLVRVGLVMRGPGIPKSSIVADPVSTTDLAASFLAWADAPSLGSMHGQPLDQVMKGGSRAFALNEWKLHEKRLGFALDLRHVRSQRFKLTYESNSETGELYDLQNDPHEMSNLWNDPCARHAQKELMDMLATRPADQIKGQHEPSGLA